jgi:hypothetical protein
MVTTGVEMAAPVPEIMDTHRNDCLILANIFWWLRLALSEGPNVLGVSFPSPEDETDPVSEMLCFLII